MKIVSWYRPKRITNDTLANLSNKISFFMNKITERQVIKGKEEILGFVEDNSIGIIIGKDHPLYNDIIDMIDLYDDTVEDNKNETNN